MQCVRGKAYVNLEIIFFQFGFQGHYAEVYR